MRWTKHDQGYFWDKYFITRVGKSCWRLEGLLLLGMSEISVRPTLKACKQDAVEDAMMENDLNKRRNPDKILTDLNKGRMNEEYKS